MPCQRTANLSQGNVRRGGAVLILTTTWAPVLSARHPLTFEWRTYANHKPEFIHPPIGHVLQPKFQLLLSPQMVDAREMKIANVYSLRGRKEASQLKPARNNFPFLHPMRCIVEWLKEGIYVFHLQCILRFVYNISHEQVSMLFIEKWIYFSKFPYLIQ